jgi:hypothetical protein
VHVSWPAHPFLAAAYSVLVIAASAGGELASYGDLFRPLSMALAFAVAAWLVSRLATSDVHRRGIVALVAVIGFATYGHWQRFFESIAPLRRVGENQVLLPIWAAALGVTALAAARPGRGYPAITRWLNITSLVLVLGSSVVVASALQRHGSASRPVASPAIQVRGTAVQPHVFLLVLDKYTGTSSLRSNYQFDNTPFERFLESHGFTVARGARANYVHTFLALASMLNWEYLHDPPVLPEAREDRWDLLYPLIEHNRTAATLQVAGYRFVFMPTSYGMTGRSRIADVQLPDPANLTRELEVVWLRTTMLNGIMELWCERQRCPILFLPWASEAARSLDWKFGQLPPLAASPQPVFVLAHLTVPHEPYIFRADCTHRAPYWPRRDDGPDAIRVKHAYAEQVQCLNRKLAQLVLEVERTSTRPVIMILQSDHGHGRLGLSARALRQTPAEAVSERLDIFAAYRLPGAPPGLIQDSTGPVNAMRTIMRHYFGVPLAPLQEASYWSTSKHPYDLTRVR